MQETLPVLIAGAGPGGLATAVALAQEGVPVIVIEAEPELPIDLRAGSFHPPTVEMFDELGIGEIMRAKGIKVDKWQMRDRKEGLIAEFDLGLLAEDTPYPYRLHCEQHKLTPVLRDRLAQLPNTAFHFSTRFISADDNGDRVYVTVEGPDGPRVIEASYLIGADGARSGVRRQLDVEFEGFTWPERFLVASTEYDLAPHGYAFNAYIADPTEWCAIFKMPHHGGNGLWRIAFPIGPEISDEQAIDLEFVRGKLAGFLPELADAEIPYRSIYRVHQRVAKTFRVGRLILVGDAAHINNPLGGMGLNSSVHDAMNLAEKLSAIWHGRTDDADSLLERYVRQRRQTNIDFVQAQTIRNKRTLEEQDPEIRRQRQEELRQTAADPIKARQYLLNSSMIAGLRKAAETA